MSDVTLRVCGTRLICSTQSHQYVLQSLTCTPSPNSDTSVTEFERDVGLSYLRGMHLNDSKGALASKKDRHENICM